MDLVELPLSDLREAPWNPNIMSPEMLARLERSIARYGVVENLVVRPVGDGFEVLSGNQRLKVYRNLEVETAPCVVVDLDDYQAGLLTQVLNRTRGEDDLGLKAELMQGLLKVISQDDLQALLPETDSTLQALATLGQENMAQHLQAWQKAQAARLHHLTFQLTPDQLEVVEEGLKRFMPKAREIKKAGPNIRGTALFLLCKSYLERRGDP
ncbi:MAG: ParB/RepB/Spo0J family partition protein [Dehalococcoidia bacterium]